MKKFCIIIVTILIVTILILVLLFFVKYKWYSEGMSINILSGKYPMFSLIGKIDLNGKISTDGTKEGYLAFGPYLPLKKGNYSVKYKIFLNNLSQNDNPSRKVGICNINIEGHPEMGAYIYLIAGSFQKKNPKEITIEFFIPGGMPRTEFRVYQYSGNNLMLVGLKLQPKSFLSYLYLRIPDFIKNNFYNFILFLFSAIFLIISFGYCWFKNKSKLKQSHIKYELLEPEGTDNSVSLVFLLQFGIVAFFSLLIFNAYLIDKIHMAIVPLSQTIAIILELSVFWIISKKFGLKLANIKYDLWDSCLFAFVFLFIFYVLIKPALPSLMPINFSNDCVTHYAMIDYIYNHNMLTGYYAASYPFGYHLITVMLAKYTGIPAVKMMHILLVFSVALTTAITHALIVRIFNLKKDGKLMALLPVFTLFWVRGYYELSFNAFFHAPMIFSYLFMMSFFWALVEYDNYPKWFIYIALNLSAIGLVYIYPLYLPILIIPFFLTALVKSKMNFVMRLKDMLIVILPAVVLTIIYLTSTGAAKLGITILNHEGYCIPFRFFDFGDFGEHKIGAIFLILSIIGVPIVVSSFKKKLAVITFTLGFLFYFGVFFVLKHYFGKFSYYQAYKILYFSPYLAVIYIAAVIYIIRKQIIKIFKPIIGEIIHKILFVFWLLFVLRFAFTIYGFENYKANYVEMLREPVYMSIDWARKNIHEELHFIYHHLNIGNWMRQGFMEEKFDAAYYSQVFESPVPTLENWLKNAKEGDVAVVDNLYEPPLNDDQKKQFEVLYQEEYSAIIRKK